ncbi:ribonuclease E inhibitor RraB [Acinetobacter halotolerans]|uniref:Ribonuclease E inhibitor RraB n=2 Tax=Acinetobacter halotolerans TaxID=1752076 RepID=A0A4Q6X9T7_9GAMM|nr:ribonuclease E inhibitor RraB [Acinetobacter halotolerans]
MITKDSLIEMFNNISINTDWDMSKPMLWGYFFTDSNKEKLEKIAPLLEAEGYRVIDIYLSDKDTPNDIDLWWLHIEKIEIHTPDTLLKSNAFFYKFAENNNIDSYDGMDVGPISNIQPNH